MLADRSAGRDVGGGGRRGRVPSALGCGTPMTTSFRSFEAFWPHYVREHSKATTRWMHFAGLTCAMACAAGFAWTRRPSLLLAGLLAGGLLGDYLGRRRVMVWGALVSAIAGVLTLFAPDVPWFVVTSTVDIAHHRRAQRTPLGIVRPPIRSTKEMWS